MTHQARWCRCKVYRMLDGAEKSVKPPPSLLYATYDHILWLEVLAERVSTKVKIRLRQFSYLKVRLKILWVVPGEISTTFPSLAVWPQVLLLVCTMNQFHARDRGCGNSEWYSTETESAFKNQFKQFGSNTHSFRGRNHISKFAQPLSPVWNSFIGI